MTPNANLFELIKALDHGEIKHFRRQSRQNPNQGTNNYLRLFEEILGAEQYHEAGIKQRFAGEGLEKHFANVKRYLYQQLLSFLAQREAEKDPRGALEQKMNEGEVLWKKGLYAQSAKIYEKLAAQAKVAGFFDLEIRALTLLQRDRIANQGKRGLESLEELDEQIQVALRRMGQLRALALRRNQMFALARQYFGLQKPEILERARGILQHPLLKNPKEEIDFFEGRRIHLICHALFANLSGDRAKHSRLQKEIVDLWESEPGMLRLFRNRYRLDLANQLGADGVRMDFSNFPEALAKLHALPAASRDEEGEVFQNTAFFELLYMLNSGQFELARKRLPSIEEGLDRYASKVNKARLFAFRYNMMVIYFVLEEYSAALKQLNLIIHDERSEHRQDIQQAARLFLLIFHFELGNYDLLEYLFRSAYRYLYARGGLGDFERAVLAFLRKSASLIPGPDMFPAFRELLGQLNEIQSDTSRRPPPGTQEIVLWLRAKLEGRRIAEIAVET